MCIKWIKSLFKSNQKLNVSDWPDGYILEAAYRIAHDTKYKPIAEEVLNALDGYCTSFHIYGPINQKPLDAVDSCCPSCNSKTVHLLSPAGCSVCCVNCAPEDALKYTNMH